MPSLNKVFLIGNLTRNPELRATPGGTSVCDLSMAVNRKYKLNDGSQKEETVFLDIVVWGHQAENAERYLQKGSPLFVEGRISVDTWEDKDKNKRSKYRIVAEKIQFLSSRGGYQQSQDSDVEGYEGDESGMPPPPKKSFQQQAKPAFRGGNNSSPMSQPKYSSPPSMVQQAMPENETPGSMPLPEKENPFEVDDQPGEQIPF